MKFNVTALEPGNLDGLIIIIFLIMLGPPVLLTIIGFILRMTKKPKAGKVFFILSGIYLVVGLGICGAMILGVK